MAKLKTKTAVMFATAALVLVGTGVYVGLRGSSALHSRLPSFKESNEDAGAVATGLPESRFGADVEDVDPRLAAAMEALRAAIYDPIESRRMPIERIKPALALFGTERREALPLLMQALKHQPDKSEVDWVGRMMNIHYMAVQGLIELGADASEATPELLQMLASNHLAAHNDRIVDLFMAVHPSPDLIPLLIPMLSDPAIRFSKGWIGRIIARLGQSDPAAAEPYRFDLAALLQHEEKDVRLEAAHVLARFPGVKDNSIVPVLKEGLNAPGLKKATQPSDGSMPSPGEWQDHVMRMAAVASLTEMGPDAKAALSELQEVVQHTRDEFLREQALRAIGTIDSKQRESMPEVERTMSEWERSSALVQKVDSGLATTQELLEALQYRHSAWKAARALEKVDPGVVRSNLPSIKAAFEKWGNDSAGYSLGQIIKDHDPHSLALALTNPALAREAAESLGDLGNSARFALPALYEAAEDGPEDARRASAEAIKQIDPHGPWRSYGFDDLHPAVSALMQASEAAGGNVRRQILDVYVRHGQDLNFVTPRQLKRFVEAVEAVDPRMHQIFVSRLSEMDASIQNQSGGNP